MKKNSVLTVGKLWTKKKVVTLLLIFFFGLSSIIALLTYYGQNVGCFTISLAEDVTNQSIYISTDLTFSWYSPRLICYSFANAQSIIYPVIKTGYIRETNGIYKGNNNTYIGYTYYIKNMGDESVNLNVAMNVAQADKNAEDAVWVWYFEGNNDSTGRIFQKKDTSVDSTTWQGYSGYREREYFQDEYTVFNEVMDNLEPGEVRKMTLILWLEGQDPDCSDNVIGGKINFNIEYNLYSEADNYE